MTGKNADTRFVERYKDRFDLEIDNDWTAREAKFEILHKFLTSTIYDNLSPFDIETNGGNAVNGTGGAYIKLRSRRPSVIYNLQQVIVDDSTSMLFGEGHFPKIRCKEEHENVNDFLEEIVESCNLQLIMLEAAETGSLGSVAIVVKVLEGRFHLEVLSTCNLTPVFNTQKPTELTNLKQRKKIIGSSLKILGYPVAKDDDKKEFYLEREWTPNEEIYYKPYKPDDTKKENFSPARDEERSTIHNLNFVPAIWIKNLPKTGSIDGKCTFESINDNCIEMNYQLSQAGRMLKYNADPTLVLKSPMDTGGKVVKGLEPLVIGDNGDAFLLQLSEGAMSGLVDFVKLIRSYCLEVAGGNRADPDKLSTIHSGKALQMLNLALILLVSKMRLTYGDGLKKLCGLMIKLATKMKMEYTSELADSDVKCAEHLTLDWPAWYAPTPQDDLQTAQALKAITDAHIISGETATTSVAERYNIEDVQKERDDVAKNLQENYDRENQNSETGGSKPKSPTTQGNDE
jgi:hypothetical protein